MAQKSNRSNGYQHLFTEQSYSNDMMADFPVSAGLVEKYKPEDKETLMDLREELTKRRWELAEEHLTERQFEVVKLMSKAFTQIEIAKQLNVNQSSITKSLNGNCDYRNGKKVYGGAKKKLRKVADNDPIMKSILERIAEIHAEYDY